jgi:hypothetical protein
MTETPPEMWWPSPEAFKDLTVTDTEEGWDLEAPDDTELGEWLAFWNQDEAHHRVFNEAFVGALLKHALETLEQHGKTEAVSDRTETDPVQTEEHFTGELA